ncbi:leucine-rich repeat domain-containing protein [Soonwooa sp.]|uniref:leucine-rich repeat domain-containing protein n=1 Tax=Soonwooa sp. TaxID=1938592 RepID=UPI0028AC0D17|nr:leucine-rich repeat domain-containing protein [Soonwooa sp.]
MLTICCFFPEALIEIENLKEINLHGNHISFIPENLDKIKELRYLNLSTNQIYDL